jgi:hypothetical protein
MSTAIQLICQEEYSARLSLGPGGTILRRDVSLKARVGANTLGASMTASRRDRDCSVTDAPLGCVNTGFQVRIPVGFRGFGPPPLFAKSSGDPDAQERRRAKDPAGIA